MFFWRRRKSLIRKKNLIQDILFDSEIFLFDISRIIWKKILIQKKVFGSKGFWELTLADLFDNWINFISEPPVSEPYPGGGGQPSHRW